MQCGGWSVRWQGFEGNDFWSGDNKASSNASSILDILTQIQKQNNVIYFLNVVHVSLSELYNKFFSS